jgi:hypothetical protein
VERAASAIAWLVPGAAGMVANRPFLAWLSVAAAASAGALWLERERALPDPLAVGALPGAALPFALGVLGVLYVGLLLVALALREKR